jgi:hypothetical protein
MFAVSGSHLQAEAVRYSARFVPSKKFKQPQQNIMVLYEIK